MLWSLTYRSSERTLVDEDANSAHAKIVRTLKERLQIERAMERGATRAEVLARLASQMPLAEKRKYADYVIDTSGAKEETLRQTQEVYNSLRS